MRLLHTPSASSERPGARPTRKPLRPSRHTFLGNLICLIQILILKRFQHLQPGVTIGAGAGDKVGIDEREVRQESAQVDLTGRKASEKLRCRGCGYYARSDGQLRKYGATGHSGGAWVEPARCDPSRQQPMQTPRCSFGFRVQHAKGTHYDVPLDMHQVCPKLTWHYVRHRGYLNYPQVANRSAAHNEGGTWD